MTTLLPDAPPSPLVIENVKPSVDGGKFPIKRVVGDTLTVTATIFRDGHGKIVPLLKYKEKGSDDPWVKVEMESLNPGLDLWQGSFYAGKKYPLPVHHRSLYPIFTTPGWPMPPKNLRDGQDIASDLLEGMQHLAETVKRLGNDEYLAPNVSNDQNCALAGFPNDYVLREAHGHIYERKQRPQRCRRV